MTGGATPKDELRWADCRQCGHQVPRRLWAEQLAVCARCGYHGRWAPRARLAALLDADSFREVDATLRSTDPLGWTAEGEDYPAMLVDARKEGQQESFIAGEGAVGGHPCRVGVFDFGFMGGTLGTVAGEKVARLLDAAAAAKTPALIFTASGGARMQEGMLSLMQMAKIAVAVTGLQAAGIPLITVLCDPTTGGVAASLAFMGDLVLAEPGALAGFAGPRVILQTIGEEMPPDIQRVERLHRDGFIDAVVPRREMRLRLIEIFARLPGA